MTTKNTPSSAERLAWTVIRDRIASLSEEDRADFFEVADEFRRVDATDDEREAAERTMLEILEQRPAGKAIPLEPVEEPDDKLRNWCDYIGGRIKELRKRAGWTQDQLAEKSGIPQSHISRLENAQHSPSAHTLEKLAKAMGLQVDELDPSA